MKGILLVLFAFLCLPFQPTLALKNPHDEAYHHVVKNLTSILSEYHRYLYNNSLAYIRYSRFMYEPSESYLKKIVSYLLKQTTSHDEEYCCGKLIACDLDQKLLLNLSNCTNDLFRSFVRNCECEREFRSCLDRVHRRVKDFHFMLPLVSTLNSPKCYSLEHPVVKCKKFQYFFEPNAIYTE